MNPKYEIRLDNYFGADLSNGAYYLFQKDVRGPQEYYDIAGYLFLAFLIEAYLNYVIGEAVTGNSKSLWNDLEKKSSPKEKYKFLRLILGEKGDELENWPESACKLFEFRNQLAHMKPYNNLKIEESDNSVDDLATLKDPDLNPRYKNFLNQNNSQNFLDEVEKFLDHIKSTCNQAGYAVGGFNWPPVYSQTSYEK